MFIFENGEIILIRMDAGHESFNFKISFYANNLEVHLLQCEWPKVIVFIVCCNSTCHFLLSSSLSPNFLHMDHIS